MKILLKKLLELNRVFFALLIFSTISPPILGADDLAINGKIWRSLEENQQVTKQLLSGKSVASLKTRVLELDEISFESMLSSKADITDISIAAKSTLETSELISTNTIIDLPLPDGSEVSVEITPSSVMSEALAKQFPQIKTWDVKGVNEDITGTVDFTHKGFHGMLVMPDGDTVYIEPDVEGITDGELTSQNQYLSFSKKENIENFTSEFSCGVHDDDDFLASITAKGTLSAKTASDIITYRLAVAATGEYSQFHGGTKELALSAIATTINRVNEIFRRDLGIQFELVDEQSDIIYLDYETDPYTNSNISKLIYENDENLSDAGDLSKTQYDIGHVFGEGDVGGLASVGGVCVDDEKAIGATGISSPVGDLFALDYVAHELGHQLGGTHTFNSACNGGSQRTAATAVEPGSGSTIMAYPGICNANDIQDSVDPQLHILSIAQISEITRSGSGSACGDQSSTTNENPIVDAGEDTVVPARTPLVFVALGSDDDDDELSYSWEQVDTGTTSDVDVDTGDNALFRSLPLTTKNIRFIPELNALFTNTTSLGETLPTTNRNINMAATIRDGNAGLAYDVVNLEVFDTGDAFSFISHTVDQWLGRQDATNIVWDVAGTDSSPISCSSVDIGIVNVDGEGFDLVSTANDGNEVVTIPDDAPAIDNARFIISCNSRFFNISSGEITILNQIGGGYGGNEIDTDDTSGGGAFNLHMYLVLLIVLGMSYSRRTKKGRLLE